MVDENVFAQTCSDRRLNDRLSPPFWPTPRPIPHQSGLTTLISLIYVERLIKIHNYVFHAVIWSGLETNPLFNYFSDRNKFLIRDLLHRTD
jgi:hypothetical protein